MPRVKAVIFCDQVRQEANGKLFIIGTYTGQMLIQQFPYQAALQPILIVEGITADVKVRAKLASRSGAAFMEMEADLTIEPDAPPGVEAWLPLPPAPVILSSEDSLQLWVSFDDEELVLAGEAPVRKASLPAA